MLRWLDRYRFRIIAALFVICLVLALAGLCYGQDLSEVPAPTMGASNDGGFASWWPAMMALVSLLVAGVSAAFAAYVKFREKAIDTRTQQETAKAKIRIRQLEVDAEQRDKVFQMLQDGNKSLVEQLQGMMETNASLLEKNESLLQENTKLKLEIDEVKDRLARLEGNQ